MRKFAEIVAIAKNHYIYMYGQTDITEIISHFCAETGRQGLRYLLYWPAKIMSDDSEGTPNFRKTGLERTVMTIVDQVTGHDLLTSHASRYDFSSSSICRRCREAAISLSLSDLPHQGVLLIFGLKKA